jgi:tetratricopeptide (TPR) repeat protein
VLVAIARIGIEGMSDAAESTGTIDVALAHASRLLQSKPQLAMEQAAEILKVAPNHPVATLLLGVAQRSSGDSGAALRTLQALVDAQHMWAAAHYELGLTLSATGQQVDAAAQLKRAVALKADLPDAWRALGDVLTATGDVAAADIAYANHIKASTRDPRLLAPASALVEKRIPEAEAMLRSHLRQYPTDVAAIRMLAEVGARLGRYVDAETLLTRCLELAPSFMEARHNLAVVLLRLNKPAAALQQVEQLCAHEPHNIGHRNLKAVVLTKVGDFSESLELFASVVAANPKHAKSWMSYAHALSTAGREAESIDAYRRCIALAPNFGEAYWSLANLKTFRFDDSEVAAIRAQLERTELAADDRFHFHFAIGKALEDARQFQESFEHYVVGNRLRREQVSYSAERSAAQLRRSKALFTASFFQQRKGYGAAAPDPIFVVGLPRSGSTLIEQILASHSAVEGTMELHDILGMAGKLIGMQGNDEDARYPAMLAGLSAAECRELGEQYLESTRIQRRSGKPFFIDKMPNNFLHLGLIQLILPNSRVIDARRHPLGCCFSGFKQHFARGQHFSYSLEDLGRYYRNYVELMNHFDQVLPGRVHRVFYESMIDDTESEVRRLLDYCGLPFEAGCLRFYENERAVRTASAQQVRKPIYREGVDQWRNFEPWLEPLKTALGSVLPAYPDVPEF